MIELKNQEQFKNVIERARMDRKNLLVQLTGEARKYKVVNRQKGQIYDVIFRVNAEGKRFGYCNCRAGELGRLCKHIAAAAALNICLAEQGRLNHLSINLS